MLRRPVAADSGQGYTGRFRMPSARFPCHRDCCHRTAGRSRWCPSRVACILGSPLFFALIGSSPSPTAPCSRGCALGSAQPAASGWRWCRVALQAPARIRTVGRLNDMVRYLGMAVQQQRYNHTGRPSDPALLPRTPALAMMRACARARLTHPASAVLPMVVASTTRRVPEARARRCDLLTLPSLARLLAADEQVLTLVYA